MVHPAIRANYYECHVTIEPLYGLQREHAASVAKVHQFSLAELHMQKRKEDTPERSKNDDFMTGRSYDLDDLSRRMVNLIEQLNRYGFKVWRYKIELTILDSRYDDKFFLLHPEDLPEKETNPRPPVHERELAEAIA